VIASQYVEDVEFRVLLTLAPALVPGAYVLLVQGVEDVAGNQAFDSLPFVFEPDIDPPTVIEVRALDASTMRVRFDEPVHDVSAAEPANYHVSDGIGHPGGVAFDPSVPTQVILHLDQALFGPHVFTLRVHDVEDLHGNAMLEQQVAFFFGIPEPPAA
jgi:hypothetical protein